jgi:hypothetical protein
MEPSTSQSTAKSSIPSELNTFVEVKAMERITKLQHTAKLNWRGVNVDRTGRPGKQKQPNSSFRVIKYCKQQAL